MIVKAATVPAFSFGACHSLRVKHNSQPRLLVGARARVYDVVLETSAFPHTDLAHTLR